MRLLAFSDLHRDADQAGELAERSAAADVVVAAGDFASFRLGLAKTLEPLRTIERPVVLVPGNHETEDQLRDACAGWEAAHVLHGEGAEIDGTRFFGVGGGIPPTPWPWSFDVEEDEAARLLARFEGGVLVVHSPPHGHLDESRGRHLGSESILAAIEERSPPVALCGHIHECWGGETRIGGTRVLNLGPAGATLDLT